MQLTTHFSLEELTVTNHRQIDNSLDPDNPAHKGTIANLTFLAECLERVRTFLGNHPLIITSGFRCPALNAAVGSKPTSAHVNGYAADFTCPAFGSVLAIAKFLANHWPGGYDQLIYEHPSNSQWVHISFAPRMRNEVLTIDHMGTHAGIVPPYGEG